MMIFFFQAEDGIRDRSPSRGLGDVYKRQAFGWLPVLLWVLIGGIFFGAVTDFGALYASVKNDGKSMGMLIEKYIGKTGRKLFLLFCWLFCGIVIAAFADMVAGTFNAFGACLLYTSPSPRDGLLSRMPSSA